MFGTFMGYTKGHYEKQTFYEDNTTKPQYWDTDRQTDKTHVCHSSLLLCKV
jgi:hypothetical protein